MHINIFTDNAKLEAGLSKVKKKSHFTITFYPYSELRKVLKCLTAPSLIYLDIQGQDDTFKKDWNFLLKQENMYAAILDPDKNIEDSSALFHSGAVDYLAGDNIKHLFTEKRFQDVWEYIKQFRSDYQEIHIEEEIETQPQDDFIVTSGWNDITEGKEYSFYLLYIEFDNKEELERKYNKKNLSETLAVFRTYIEKHIAPYNGRIWMWHDFGGIVLFPYTSGECLCVISAFKIMLYKLLYDAEESNFPHFISFRMAMHLGNLVYHRQQTGNIISDTINSIFHLGKIFTGAGNMNITEEIMQRTPEYLQKYFITMGKYEDRSIYRMRQLLFLVTE